MNITVAALVLGAVPLGLQDEEIAGRHPGLGPDALAGPFELSQLLEVNDDEQWLIDNFSTSEARCIGGSIPLIDGIERPHLLVVHLVPHDARDTVVTFLLKGRSGYEPAYMGYQVLMKAVHSGEAYTQAEFPDYPYAAPTDHRVIEVESRLFVAVPQRRERQRPVVQPGAPTAHLGSPRQTLALPKYRSLGKLRTVTANCGSSGFRSIQLIDPSGVRETESVEYWAMDSAAAQISGLDICNKQAELNAMWVEAISEPIRVNVSSLAGRAATLWTFLVDGDSGVEEGIAASQAMDATLERSYGKIAGLVRAQGELDCAKLAQLGRLEPIQQTAEEFLNEVEGSPGNCPENTHSELVTKSTRKKTWTTAKWIDTDGDGEPDTLQVTEHTRTIVVREWQCVPD